MPYYQDGKDIHKTIPGFVAGYFSETSFISWARRNKKFKGDDGIIYKKIFLKNKISIDSWEIFDVQDILILIPASYEIFIFWGHSIPEPIYWLRCCGIMSLVHD
jgi:hypothetical protein